MLSCMNSQFKLCFQVHLFLNIEHKFDNLINQTIKNYLSQFVQNTSSNLLSEQSSTIESRNRFNKCREKSSHSTWSQTWTIDRSEFRKVVIKLKKNANLFNSFAQKHFRQSFCQNDDSETIKKKKNTFSKT